MFFLLTRYAPTVPCASMSAHSEIRNILIFEKHEEFLRRPSPSSMSPPLRSESRCFFTCILPLFIPTALREKRNTQREEEEEEEKEEDRSYRRRWQPRSFASSPRRRLHSRRRFNKLSVSHLTTNYETHVQTPRGSAARPPLNIAAAFVDERVST